ncbi:uncharacterized protein LOC111408600 [Olea europaea var. sylvestris]|uniref:uncharacterized protein LOC111408600 n=1 Tax=Olea europaea var. sylvestris TaxID=158386 RepID=UPI000C1D6272|nr:uncharacterized protein LOC111408600 [Olea europaea var. sylvestris]
MYEHQDNSNSSSTHSVSPSHHSNPKSNIYSANYMARYLNLNNPINPFQLDNGDNPAVILVTDLLIIDDPQTTWWCRGSRTQLALSIKSSVAFVDDACEIWSDLQDRFSQQNGPRIFQLKKSLASISQDNDSISFYRGKLKTFCDELSVYDPIPVCNCGTMKTLVDRYQPDCVFQFLMGLHGNYSNVRDQIMLLDPLPPATKVFSLIQQQERQHSLVQPSPSPDSMAMAFKRAYSTPKYPTQQKERLPILHSLQNHRPYL